MASTSRSQDQRNANVLPEPSIGNYIVRQAIGKGSFATVYKGYDKKTHKKVAIKSVLRSKLTKKLLENLESEISILKSIQHDHIVQLMDCQKSDTHIHLIMEYCSMGDLSNFIKRRGDVNGYTLTIISPNGWLEEYVVLHFLKQLANALEFLRSQNLIHRDIKPQNLLLLPPSPDKEKRSTVGSPDLPILKIADFGFARSLPSTNLAETLCGSPLYMAPEILRYEKYDAKADLWSVGAVLYEMCVGKQPFRASNHFELLKKIEVRCDRIKFPGDKLGNGKSNLDKTSKTPTINEELKNLIRHLLKRNPVERISFEEFFMHPCIAGDLGPRITRNTSSKEKLVQVTKDGTVNSVNSNNSMDNDISKRSIRDRSISSPVPVSNKEQAGTSHNTRTFQNNTRINSNRRGSETSPKELNNGNTNLKPSRESVKHPSIRDLHPSGGTLGIGQPPELTKQNDNNDLQPSYENPSPSPSLLVQKSEETSKSVEEEVQFLREYVVIDSKKVEVNKLADELNESPKSTDPQCLNTNTGPSPHIPYYTYPPFALPPTSHEKVCPPGSNGQSALARALSTVSFRLLGTGNSPPMNDKYSKQKENITFSSDGTLDPVEEGVVKAIEDYAYKAHVVYQFAETKYNLLMPPPPTASSELVDTRSTSTKNDALLAQEAVVLYLKCLSLLQSAMEKAKEYWANIGKQRSEYPGGKPGASLRFNNDVQWVRTRFNVCLEKAEFVKSKSLTEETTKDCFAEKLLYDRACEMSRQAAVNELTGQDLPGCERAYQSAIYMLNAILESTPEDGDTLDDQDRQIVNKFIVSITKRLNSLKKKPNVPVTAGDQGIPS
ncbi:4108_t:CDS:10 [Diversispora eburnea]|uniref:non-specific serine/threonine protein kinase n=1 Tax=Diversispora eburnea TaxID=1213867 RepID=A0A9N8VA76_9GLOM|nr:4108_t:CDS:10 [Diversispora eburnea]